MYVFAGLKVNKIEEDKYGIRFTCWGGNKTRSDADGDYTQISQVKFVINEKLEGLASNLRKGAIVTISGVLYGRENEDGAVYGGFNVWSSDEVSVNDDDEATSWNGLDLGFVGNIEVNFWGYEDGELLYDGAEEDEEPRRGRRGNRSNSEEDDAEESPKGRSGRGGRGNGGSRNSTKGKATSRGSRGTKRHS